MLLKHRRSCIFVKKIILVPRKRKKNWIKGHKCYANIRSGSGWEGPQWLILVPPPGGPSQSTGHRILSRQVWNIPRRELHTLSEWSVPVVFIFCLCYRDNLVLQRHWDKFRGKTEQKLPIVSRIQKENGKENANIRYFTSQFCQQTHPKCSKFIFCG